MVSPFLGIPPASRHRALTSHRPKTRLRASHGGLESEVVTKGSHEKVEVVCSSEGSLLVLSDLNNVHRNGVADWGGLLG